MSDSVYVAHLVSQIQANVSVLASQGKISHADAAAIRAKLPPTPASEPVTAPRASAFPAPSFAPVHDSPLEPPVSHPSPVVHPPQPHHSPAIPENANPPNNRSSTDRFKRARALWTYSGSAPDDLSFSKGDTIVILAEENADWWKGEVVGSQGRPGLFPSNHVEIISNAPEQNSHSSRAPTGAGGAYPSPAPSNGGYSVPAPAGQTYSNPPPTHDHYQAPYNPSQTSQYPPPPPAQGPSYGTPPVQPYAQPNNQWQAPTYAYNQADYKQPPPLEHSQSAPPTQQVTVEKPKKKPFQGRLGQAFVGGAGFGAGSAVASNLVNAIL